MNELLGSTVLKVSISEDHTILVFDTDLGRFYYQTFGDCCSETWIDSLTGFDVLIGSPILTHEAVEMPAPAHRVPDYKNHFQEELEDYGVKLTTAKGYVDIVYRNSSNGYYGGSINLIALPPENTKLTEITDDWTAS